LYASPGDALSFSLALPLAGTFIGDFDAASNPTGTQTRPNLFGGSGNNPIAYSSTAKPTVNLAFPLATPVFTICLQDDGDGGAIVTCVDLDMVRGTPSPISLNLTLTYPNFHTVQPTAIYPGISNITLPLPAGEIIEARAVQSEPAQGVIVPGKGGSLIVTAAVPAELSFEASLFSTPIVVPPTPIVLPLVIELVPSLNGTYTAFVSLEVPTTETEIPTGGQSIENAPFDLPTVLPPGSFAHLLVSGTFLDGTLSFGLSADLSGDGVKSGPPADLNGDCVVNGADLAILLGTWGPCAGCPADLNGDGVVNGADLAVLLGSWG